MLPSLLLVYWYCCCFQNDEVVVNCVCCWGGGGPEEAAHQGGDQAAQCQERHPCQVLMDCFIIKNKVKVSYPSIKISLSGINYLYHDQDRHPCLALQPLEVYLSVHNVYWSRVKYIYNIPGRYSSGIPSSLIHKKRATNPVRYQWSLSLIKKSGFE